MELDRADALRSQSFSEGGARILRIAIPDPRVSASHARLEKVLGSWMLEDRGSKNGTFLDGQRISRDPVPDGSIVEVGHTFFVFRHGPAANEPDELSGDELKSPARGLATFSPALASEFERVALVARSRV
ncbi:MAG: FHA domain-containing protein, partial [Myxococcales bacterium]